MRHAKFWNEEQEDQELSDDEVEYTVEHPSEVDQDGNPIYYQERYNIHDISVMHETWQDTDEQGQPIGRQIKYERDDTEKTKMFN